MGSQYELYYKKNHPRNQQNKIDNHCFGQIYTKDHIRKMTEVEQLFKNYSAEHDNTSEPDPSSKHNQYLEHNHSSDLDNSLKHKHSKERDQFKERDHSSEHIHSEKNAN